MIEPGELRCMDRGTAPPPGWALCDGVDNAKPLGSGFDLELQSTLPWVLVEYLGPALVLCPHCGRIFNADYCEQATIGTLGLPHCHCPGCRLCIGCEREK